MSSISNLSRRALVKWGLVSAGLPAISKVLASPALAQDAGSESGKRALYGQRIARRRAIGNPADANDLYERS